TRHRLVLVPSHPPRLLMRSTEGEVIDKLDHAITSQTAEGDTDEVAALTVAKTEAQEVLQAANDENFADHPEVETPELDTLASQLHTIGDQFDEHDLPEDAATAATHPALPYTPGDVIPDNVLGMTSAAFETHVSNLDSVAALEVIDQNYEFLSGWYAKIQSWFDNHRYERGPDSTTAHNDATAVSRRLQWTLDRRRRLRLDLNPDSRVALPCFARGTRIATPSGTRAIETMRIGDEVWSADPATRERVIGRVGGLLVNRTVDLHDLTIGRDTVSTTGDHPFWVEDQQTWIAARELVPGMQLRTLDGDTRSLVMVAQRGVGVTPTFNLAVDPHPTYFVGDGVLVHNGSYGLLVTYPWPANFKIYVGLNDADEFKDYIYIGQTMQTLRARERQHHDDAREWLSEHTDPTDPDHFFYRFKLGMRITAIAGGLRDKPMASYLEQTNIDLERRLRGANFVVNRRDEVSDMPSLRSDLRADTDVHDKGYCV
ncbi:MAG: polymorphic toxin-type HINT domain-containing protein, partial [Kofleriaceae bacterium]